MKGVEIYNSIIIFMKNKNITVTEIAKKTGIKKQTVSYKILNIKKREILDLNFLSKLENIFGENIIFFKK